jgi:hypothetical protein
VSDRDPTELEKREAEALARALEGDPPRDEAPPGIPPDALQAASLLRASREDAGLDPARQRQILEKILPEKEGKARGIPWLRWLVPVAAVAGVLFVIMTVPMYSKSPQAGAVMFPTPPRSLLRIQARAAEGEDLKALEQKMRVYRRRMYASLSGKYPGSP